MIMTQSARAWLAGNALPASLACLTATAAGAALMTGATSWPEAVAFVTGVTCVWLVTRQNIWNYPFGLVTTLIYAFIFLRSGLVATAGLQLVFFALNLIGWYLWLYGGKDRSVLQVRRAPRVEWVLTGLFIAAGSVVLMRVLNTGGDTQASWPGFLDALATSISLAAQWAQSRKILQCWWLWILVNVIYIPLCAHSGLYLTALLYAVFLILAIIGLIQWKKSVQ